MAEDADENRVRLTTAESRAQRRRSVAIALTLAGLAVLFYVVSLIKMGADHV